MKFPAAAVTACLLATAAALWALLQGGDWLQVRQWLGVPAGNVVAAVLLCAPAAAAWFSASGGRARAWTGATLAAAVAWLPLSIGLAGNAALNFHGGRGVAWFWMTVGLVVMIELALAWTGAAAVGRRWTRRRARSLRPR